MSRLSFLVGADETNELHLWISYETGFQFPILDGGLSTAYDTIEKTWRHLNFFEHRCYLHARVPRIKSGEHEIHMVKVPWARENSGFTLLFEAYAMLLIEKEMPVSSVSGTLKETAPRIWRVFTHWIQKAFLKDDLSSVRQVGVDETSRKKGISNGILEGINSKIQLAKRRDRGYTNIENFISMIYFIAGKLKVDYPHDSL